MRVARIVLGVALGVFALATAPGPGSTAAAQTRAPDGERFVTSPYLPLGHWAYDYLDILIARGRINGLSPLTQPYRRADIAAALVKARRDRVLSPIEAAWVSDLEQELTREIELVTGRREQEVRFNADLGVGLKGLTHTHRDLLRPAGDENVFPTVYAGFEGDAPFVAGALRGRWDNHLLNDPQFPGGRAIEFRECDPLIAECAYRVEDAYVELQAPYVRLFFGRTYRNWGLPRTNGLLVSDYSYSYDHVAYRFGSSKIALSGLFAPFNDFAGDTARYFSTHRFDFRIRDNLLVSVSESVVYGGINRRLDFNLTNPVGIWEVSGSSEGGVRNALGLAEIWWRPVSGLVGYGAFVVDNTSVGDEVLDKSTGFNQYAAALGIQLPSLTPRLGVRFDFSVVNSLAYRSRVDFFEYYALDDIGLARDKTDAVVASLQGDWFVRPDLVIKPGLALQLKGADDITDPFPEDAFTGHDLLLVGEVETTLRPSIGGRWHVRAPTPALEAMRVDLEWDVGLNVIKDEDNQPVGWDSKLVGRALLRVIQRF